MKALILILVILFQTSLIFGQEICTNGIDDDGDGLIDLNDTVDCICQQSNVTSMLTNPSFEDYTNCPTGWAQTSGYIVGWSNGSYATPDYCNTNCGFVSYPCFGITPYDGAGMLGFLINGTQQNNTMYMEYLATCLNSPMLAGTTYTYTFYIAGGYGGSTSPCTTCTSSLTNYNIAIYGSDDCTDFPFGDPPGTMDSLYYPVYTGQNCPTSNWTKLGVASYSISATWTQLTITFTPTTNINAVLIGGDCPLPAGYPNQYAPCKPYFFVDKLEITSSSSISSNPIGETGSVSSNDLILNGVPTTGATYQWFHDGVALSGETNTNLNYSINSYSDGVYSFVTYLNGMCSISTIVISSTAPLAEAGPDQSLCGLSTYLHATLSNGTGIWTQKSGPGTLTFTPSNTPTSSLSASVSGVYTLLWTETNSIGLSSQDSVQITFNNLIIANAGNDTALCKGNSLVLTAGGGANYLWNVGGTSSSITVSPVVNTSYSVEVSANGCSDIDTVNVAIVPLVDAGSNKTICIGESAVLSAIGTGTFSWNTIPNQNAQSISVYPNDTTKYIVTQTNSYCVSSDSVIVFVNPLPVANAGVDFSLCKGQTALLSASGGTAYFWSNNLGTQSTASVIPQITSTYSVQVTLNNCINKDTVKVFVLPIPNISVSSEDETCNMSNGVAMASASGGSGVYLYKWNNGLLTPTIMGLTNGLYLVTVTDSISSCKNTDSVFVQHLLGPDAYFVISNKNPNVNEEQVDFSDFSSGNVVSWSWNIGQLTTSNSNDCSYTFESSGIYPIILIVTDSNGCKDIYVDTVKVLDNYTLYIPNAFTPNGNEVNKGFGPIGENIDLTNYRMRIFNRWGNLVFETFDFDEKWNGTLNNEGSFKDAISDVYIYQIQFKGADLNLIREYYGKVTLIK